MNFEPIHSARTNHISFGAIDFTGALAVDSYIEIAPNTDAVISSQDAGGYGESISIISDLSATVTLQLQSQSIANNALAELMRRDRINGTVSIADINIVANGTNYLYDLKSCYITGRPTETKSADMSTTTNTWTFRCAQLVEKQIENHRFEAGITANITSDVNSTISIGGVFTVFA